MLRYKPLLICGDPQSVLVLPLPNPHPSRTPRSWLSHSVNQPSASRGQELLRNSVLGLSLAPAWPVFLAGSRIPVPRIPRPLPGRDWRTQGPGESASSCVRAYVVIGRWASIRESHVPTLGWCSAGSLTDRPTAALTGLRWRWPKARVTGPTAFFFGSLPPLRRRSRAPDRGFDALPVGPPLPSRNKPRTCTARRGGGPSCGDPTFRLSAFALRGGGPAAAASVGRGRCATWNSRAGRDPNF